MEAHQFRIDTQGAIGRPTPEGANRDGVDFVAVGLVRRRAVRGGETRVFEAHGNRGVRFTMDQPWSMLLMEDARVVHETTPIQADTTSSPGNTPAAAQPVTAVRDTLVLTYRARGFQQPASGD
ncbi:MAG TPA: 2OG-Fe dioxygenase family protein [Steroidobacteraceae bacterium]|nr:2OG-Fe dioxygenase family protein [Steroidobacteraceae bacterium]